MPHSHDNLADDPFCTFRAPTDGLPWFINLSITNRCNLSCPMCLSNAARPEQIEAHRLFAFIEKLRGWLPPPRRVTLTGGEPLMHPEIEGFVRVLSGAGYVPVINTNGAALTVETVERLCAAGLSAVNLSLDGPGRVHDEMRNGPGLFRGLMDILHYLANHTKLQINLVSVISAQNASTLPELIESLYPNPRINTHAFQAVVPVLSKGWTTEFFEDNPLWPHTDQQRQAIFAAMDQLEALRNNGAPIKNPPSQFAHWRRYFQNPDAFFEGRACDVAESMMQMMADGTLTFCHFHPPLGTIDDDPVALWNSDQAARTRESMQRCKRPCNYFVNCCYLEPPFPDKKIKRAPSV